MQRHRLFRTVFLLVIASVTIPTFAIIRRDDVDDARYLALGEKYRGVLVALAIPAQIDGAPMLYSGMGTLVGKDWVITAAHAASALLTPGTQEIIGGNHFVFLRGRGYRVAHIYLHPDWKAEESANDIALIHLEHEVNEAAPACVYTKADEEDKIVTVVGQGLPGTGASGAGKADGALRAATVRVGTANATALTWIFHKPTDPSVTPMEGISGPGDSGGPALVEMNHQLCIVGVSSTQAFDADVGQGHYGAKETYTRVSAFSSWIEKTMKVAP
jgi:secreted trypsin-like serine protease